MAVACIIIKHLPSRVESARHSCPRHSPLVVYDANSPLQRVVDASPGWFVHPEMPLETAISRCPDAVTIAADPGLYTQRWRAVITRLRSVRDAVDDAGLGAAYVRTDTGDGSPHGEPRVVADLMQCIPSDWEPQVGIAKDRLAAHCAASIARPNHALRVPDAPEPRRHFLAPLSVNLLPVDVHILAALHDLGIHRLGQLDDLSPNGLETAVAELAREISICKPHRPVPCAA